ncbi:MAG TPA: hypothetical protein VJ965_04785, partial [Anaerolineales bacterium]|nr:hypothetical protein [Anaerolineales bacterium]
VNEGRLTLDDILTRMHTNPRKIFGLPPQPETTVQIDLDHKSEITADGMFSRAQWTPFEGMTVYGAVRRVTLRGTLVVQDGKILAQPGFGTNIRA